MMKSLRHVSLGIMLAALVCIQSGCKDDRRSQEQTPAVTTAQEQTPATTTTQDQALPPAITTTVAPAISFLGKNEAEVLGELGQPQGKLSGKGRIVWTYERGSLEFTNGIVALSRIMSPDQYAQFQLAKQKRAEEARAKEQLQLQRDAQSWQHQNAAAALQSQQAASNRERYRQSKESKKGYVASSTVVGGKVITSVATESPEQRAARRATEERYRNKLKEINDQFRTREREDRAIYETALKSQPREVAQNHYKYLQQQTSDAKRNATEEARTAYENELSHIPSDD